MMSHVLTPYQMVMQNTISPVIDHRDERQKKNKNVVADEKTTDEDYRKTINKMLDDIHDPKKLKQIYTQIQWHYVRENNGCQEVHS